MYVKVETGRLNSIPFNLQLAKLRSKEYIHFQFVIANDANVNDIGCLAKVPCSCIGSHDI